MRATRQTGVHNLSTLCLHTILTWCIKLSIECRMSTAEYQNYLKDVLLEKRKKNRTFSLRAFAKLVGLQPSLLSDVLNGRRNITEETAVTIAQKLGLGETEATYFQSLVRIGRAKNPAVKEVFIKQLEEQFKDRKPVHDLTVDHFVVISDWHHLAILKLLDIAKFDFKPSAIAAALEIDPIEVEQALARLVRLGILEQSPHYKRVTSDFVVQSVKPNDALKKYHQQVLTKTIEAQSTQTPHERYTGTENIALSADQLKQAAEIFEECFQKVIALSEKRKPEAEVYHLGIHLIRLSTTTRSITKPPKGKT